MSRSLERAIRLPHATALVVGSIIGASIFVQPSEVTSQVHSVWLVLAVWLASGVVTLIGSLVCAELASTWPRTGGVYVYLTEAFHPLLGFLWGWAMLVTMHTGIIAAIATVFARYAAVLVPLGDVGSRVLAVAVIALLSAVNYYGVRQGSTLQLAFTVVKVVAVVAIILLGVALGPGAEGGFRGPTDPLPDSIGGFLAAMVAGLFTYGGWHLVTYSAGETVEPSRTIPRALVFGTVLVTAIYVAMNAVYLYVLPFDAVAGSTRVAADYADALLGAGGAELASAIVLFSTFGALAGIILAGPRVYLAMARNGVLPPWLGAIHPKYATPHRAIILQAVWAAILVATGTFRALFTRVIYTEWIFFGLLAIGLLILRRKPGITRIYTMPLSPLLPVLFALTSFAVVINTVINDPREAAFGLGIILIGVPFFLFRRGKAAQPVGFNAD
ncbi:MAG: amino acid permease [Gemmatimonadota bacterium]